MIHCFQCCIYNVNKLFEQYDFVNYFLLLIVLSCLQKLIAHSCLLSLAVNLGGLVISKKYFIWIFKSYVKKYTIFTQSLALYISLILQHHHQVLLT